MKQTLFLFQLIHFFLAPLRWSCHFCFDISFSLLFLSELFFFVANETVKPTLLRSRVKVTRNHHRFRYFELVSFFFIFILPYHLCRVRWILYINTGIVKYFISISNHIECRSSPRVLTVLIYYLLRVINR